MVSLDPARDTPTALNELADKHHVDRARWRFVRPAPADVRTIAALLGVRYRALPGGELAHSALITALDRDGRILASVAGLDGDAKPVIETIEATVASAMR